METEIHIADTWLHLGHYALLPAVEVPVEGDALRRQLSEHRAYSAAKDLKAAAHAGVNLRPIDSPSSRGLQFKPSISGWVEHDVFTCMGSNDAYHTQ